MRVIFLPVSFRENQAEAFRAQWDYLFTCLPYQSLPSPFHVDRSVHGSSHYRPLTHLSYGSWRDNLSVSYPFPHTRTRLSCAPMLLLCLRSWSIGGKESGCDVAIYPGWTWRAWQVDRLTLGGGGEGAEWKLSTSIVRQITGSMCNNPTLPHYTYHVQYVTYYYCLSFKTVSSTVDITHLPCSCSYCHHRL